MQQQITLTKNEMAIWTWLVSKGIASALAGLSQMVGQELNVTSLDLKHVPAKEATNLLGGPENLVIGIYLTVHGDAAGHLMLIHEPKIAFELIDMQMGLVSGSTRSLDEMERSVMAEMGNITGSFFLNALADATNLSLIPSPPAVLIDMAGAILGIALTEIMQEQDDIIVVKTAFGTTDREVNGTFLVMPTMSFLKTILEHSGAPWQ